MHANEREDLYELFKRVVGAAYEVANVLGPGFLEKVYARGVRAEPQAPIGVWYKGEHVGEYYADVLVDGKLIVELGCVERLGNEHLAQCVNYL